MRSLCITKILLLSFIHQNIILTLSFTNIPLPCQVRPKIYGRLKKPCSIFCTTETISDDSTVRIIENKNTKETVTLIGTAHLSKSSVDQVRDIIGSSNADAVMVELDLSRLERIGMKNGVNDLDGLSFSTSENIVIPLLDDDIKAIRNRNLLSFFENRFLDVCAFFARKTMTLMYNDMGEAMGGLQPGGEFLAAIVAAKKLPSCKRIIFGDRDSVATIRRAGELALRSGDPFSVISRFAEASDEQIKVIENEVRDKLINEGYEGDFESAVKVALVERMRGDYSVRENIFSKLEEEVPEFMRAFVIERDYVMAKAIEDEIKSGKSKNIVAVVGVAHVQGMAKNLLNGLSSSGKIV